LRHQHSNIKIPEYMKAILTWFNPNKRCIGKPLQN